MHYQLTHALHRAVQLCPQATAVVCGERRFTWQQFLERTARVASVLRAHGVKPDDRVGLLALNSDRWLEVMAGTWWAGAGLNPVNTRWTAAEVAFSLDDCATELLFVDDASAPLVPQLRQLSSSLKTVIHIGEGAAPAGALAYEALMSAAEPIPDAHAGDDTLAGVYYTGGTTGFPKGVMLTHQGLLSNALGNLLDLPYDADEVVLAAAPLFHQAGMCIVIRALVRLSQVVVVPAFQPEPVMDAIQTHHVTFTLLVPTMIQMLIDHEAFERYDLSSLRKVLYGASPVSEGLLIRMLEKLPAVRFTQGYGMTETSGPYTILAPYYHTPQGRNPDRLRAAGRPMWGMEVRVVDSEGRDLPPGQVGEIVARGTCIMKGYWNRPEETAAALRDGWLYSGDGGYLDEEGFIFLVDRVKDMIVSGGENVYSTEVENAISKHPAVASCAVIGIPHERWIEAVHAVVVLKKDAQLSAEELRAHCKTLIANYKCPTSVEFRAALPVSGAGKVLKHVLREPFRKAFRADKA